MAFRRTADGRSHPLAWVFSSHLLQGRSLRAGGVLSRSGTSRRLTAATVACVLALTLPACAVGGSTTCKDFNGMKQSDQLNEAATVASSNTKQDKLGEVVAPVYRQKLIEYCSQSGHGDDELKSLSLRYGP